MLLSGGSGLEELIVACLGRDSAGDVPDEVDPVEMIRLEPRRPSLGEHIPAGRGSSTKHQPKPSQSEVRRRSGRVLVIRDEDIHRDVGPPGMLLPWPGWPPRVSRGVLDQLNI